MQHRTTRRLAVPSLLLLLSATGGAQDVALGWRSVRLANPADTGSKQLGAIVHYPATVAKEGAKAKGPRNRELAKQAKGYPVVVFLHGFGASGGVMIAIGQHLARHGYIAVLTNTTRSKRPLQALNAHAFYAALQQENLRKDSPFAGQLDMKRAGISGHSMGGGNAARVLADNPGFRAGFCFAPWTTRGAGAGDYVRAYASKIVAPIAIVHGTKDRILPWKKNALRFYEALPAKHPYKVFWLLDKQASHVNIAVPSLFRRTPDPTFVLCADMAVAFFDRHLKGELDTMGRYMDAKKKPAGVLELHSQTKPAR